MKANDFQHGGNHYKTKYEHWDLVIDTRMGYFEGNATKYVSRWRKKGGLEDLRKALHYVTKLEENLCSQRSVRDAVSVPPNVQTMVLQFGYPNDLQKEELAIVMLLAGWTTPSDLAEAKGMISQLIRQHEETEAPLTEENKHAPRAELPKAQGSGGFAK